MEDELEFYTRRALEERRAADCSPTPEAKKTHLGLAETFMEKAREAGNAHKRVNGAPLSEHVAVSLQAGAAGHHAT